MVNIKRGILLAILSYVVSFGAGILAAMLMGVDLTTAEEAPTSVWIVGIFATIVIAYLFTTWYFKDESIRPSAREGMQFALILFLVSFALDLAVIIPFMLTSASSADITAYYTDPLFWIIVLAMFVTCTYVGFHQEQAQKASKKFLRASAKKAPKKRSTQKKTAKKKSATKKSSKAKKKQRKK